MNEFVEDATDELKRLDHIIFVSLKYTRTVDVIRNALTRMITSFDKMMDALLKHAQDQGKITMIPRSPRMKNQEVVRLYGEDPRTSLFMNFYTFLRNLMKADFKKRDEYRRHVTMIAHMVNATAEIDIDVLEDSFHKVATDFFKYTREMIFGEEDG